MVCYGFLFDRNHPTTCDCKELKHEKILEEDSKRLDVIKICYRSHPPPHLPHFTLSTITSKVVVYALAERADTLILFLLYPVLLCGVNYASIVC
jgi:hypothetical protein